VPVLEHAPVPSLYRALPLGPSVAFVPVRARTSLHGVDVGQAKLVGRADRPARIAVHQTPRATIVRITSGSAPGRMRSIGSTTTVRFARVSLPLYVLVGTERRVVRRPARAWSVRRPAATSGVYRFSSKTSRVAVPFPPGIERQALDCNRYDDRSPREVGLRAKVVEQDGTRTLRLAARDHAACISLPIPYRVRVPLLLRLEYRTVTGAPARVCVWDEARSRCATLPPLVSAPGWHLLRAAMTPPFDAGPLRLFLYADGGGDTTTQTEYRAISVERARPVEAIAIQPAVRLPHVSYRRVSPSKFRVHVANARRPFLLVASETYAPGWRAHAAGRSSAGVEHLRVNGYANGWRIPWRGTYDLTLEYAPEQTARLARLGDLVLIPLTVAAWLAWRLRARLRSVS
jgi:hypothetical protein